MKRTMILLSWITLGIGAPPVQLAVQSPVVLRPVVLRHADRVLQAYEAGGEHSGVRIAVSSEDDGQPKNGWLITPSTSEFAPTTVTVSVT